MWLDILMLLPHQDETTIHVEGEPLLGLLDSLLLRTLCLVPRISRTWKPRIWLGHWVARKCSGREPGSSHGSNGSSSSWTYDSLRIHMYARAINACRCSYIYNGYQFDMTCPCMIYTCVRSYQDQLWLRNGLYITVLLTLLITYLFLYRCGIT